MCAELRGKLLALALLLASPRVAAGTEATHPPEGPQDRTPQQKGRLSLQNTGTAGWGVQRWGVGGGGGCVSPSSRLAASGAPGK